METLTPSHDIAIGTRVKLFGLEHEGVFTVAAHTGHNLFSGLPAYSLHGEDGEILTCVTQPFLLPQP